MTTLAVQISSFKRPSEIPKHTWRHLLSVLRALTKYLPDPYPSTRELARRVNLDQSTVSRLLIRAEELGFIHRTPRVTATGHQSYAYTLLFDAKRDANATEKTSSSPTEKTAEESAYGPAAHQDPSPRRVNRWAGKCAVCPFLVQPREGWLHGKLPVHRECDQGRPDLKYEREHQGDLNPSGVIGEDPTSAPQGAGDRPGVVLARQFDSLWYSEVIPHYPLWKSHRPSHRGPASGYIDTMFLKHGYTPEHVEAMFMAFFDDLADPHSTLELRDGQTPWQLFTGWWGTTEVPDPAIDRARREENQRIADRFESRIAAEQPARDAARARLFALADGEVGDPEDYRLAGLPMPWKRKLG